MNKIEFNRCLCVTNGELRTSYHVGRVHWVRKGKINFSRGHWRSVESRGQLFLYIYFVLDSSSNKKRYEYRTPYEWRWS